MASLFGNPAVAARTYGLDGDIRVLRFDANEDGVLNPAAGDRAILYFGMRRGGRNYYALDVTNRAAPRLLWNLGPSELPGVGETWSQPTVARVTIGGAAQNGEKLVLILGGGYDGAQENYSFVNDSSGHRIYMVDAVSGALLWYAGGPGGAGSPDLQLERMRHSIPSRITVIDTDGDKFADRMYAGDMGGRVWRFDISNGNSRGSLVAGGVMATLGNGDTGGTTLPNNRRFYNAPDVALMQRRAADPYYNIAIGSGYRGHPLESETRDRFYALRDKAPFTKLTQLQYDNLTPTTDAGLTDISDNPGGTTVSLASPGWKLELRRNGGWIGEKVLSDAVTINGVVLFTTYQPETPADQNPCLPANGRNRVYALKVDDSAPALDLNDNQRIDAGDISRDLLTRGIAGEVTLVVESRLDGNGNDNGDLDELGRRTFCAVGVEVLAKCLSPGGVVRTFWQRSAPDGND
jgi:type IV pilus assembly protein PilY1